MDSVTQIAAQGASSLQSADTRTTLAQQVQGPALADGGYQPDAGAGPLHFQRRRRPESELSARSFSAPNGVDQLSNAASTRMIQNPEGGTFQASMTAQQIFDDQNSDGSAAPDNVFAALNSLRTALLNNDSAGITAAQTLVQQASTSSQRCAIVLRKRGEPDSERNVLRHYLFDAIADADREHTKTPMCQRVPGTERRQHATPGGF